jgi:hypothetical protein
MEDIQAVLERPKLYDNVDGSNELMLGCMLIGFTTYQWVGYHAERNSFWNSVYALYIFIAVLIAALIYGRKVLKSLITYRRTGFVSYRKPRFLSLFLIGLLAAGVAGGLTLLIVGKQGMNSTSLATIGVGLLMSAAYAYGIARVSHWKWVVAAFLAICAIVVALLPEQLATTPIPQSALAPAFDRRLLGSLFWCNAAYGVILLISGCISLAFYLRDTRKAETE